MPDLGKLFGSNEPLTFDVDRNGVVKTIKIQ